MAKILSVYNRLQAGDYENGNGGKRRVSRLTQFIHATLQLQVQHVGTGLLQPPKDYATALQRNGCPSLVTYLQTVLTGLLRVLKYPA